MNIPINQDIETTYRNEFVKGFSIYEFGVDVQRMTLVVSVWLITDFMQRSRYGDSLYAHMANV